MKSIGSIDTSVDRPGHFDTAGKSYFTTSSDVTERRRLGIITAPVGGYVDRRTENPVWKEKVENVSFCATRITISASGQYPFATGALHLWGAIVPNIDYKVEFYITSSRTGPSYTYAYGSRGGYATTTVQASGAHNEFPNYEILLNQKSMYQYDTKDEGPGVINLNSSVYFHTEVALIKG